MCVFPGFPHKKKADVVCVIVPEEQNALLLSLLTTSFRTSEAGRDATQCTEAQRKKEDRLHARTLSSQTSIPTSVAPSIPDMRLFRRLFRSYWRL